MAILYFVRTYQQFYTNKSIDSVWRVDGRIIKQALVAKMRGKRSVGRPRTRWRDSVVKDLRVIQEKAQIDMAYNIEEWNKCVIAALDFNGPLSC